MNNMPHDSSKKLNIEQSEYSAKKSPDSQSVGVGIDGFAVVHIWRLPSQLLKTKSDALKNGLNANARVDTLNRKK